MKLVPKINATYWASLILASIFGANAGDFVADVMHLGHLSGIPYLVVALAAVFLIERFSPQSSAVYFWIAIIIVRAAATNIGDVFHDYKIGFAYSVPLMAVLLVTAVAIWRMARPSAAAGESVPVDGFYWVTMFIAGVLGTVGGDAASYGVRLGNLNATIVLGIPLALVLFNGRNGLLRQLYYYWLTVALIRSAGTAAGDWLAHTVFGLAISTVVIGVTFFAWVTWSYARSRENVRPAVELMPSPSDQPTSR